MSLFTRMIWVTETFDALHCWQAAPESVSFLRNLHRHVFHVKLYVAVKHGDRDVEFINLKHLLRVFLNEEYEGSATALSCEQFGEEILNRFPEAVKVEVSEDGENGAIVQRV